MTVHRPSAKREERPRAFAMTASAAGTKASTQEEENSDGYVIDRLVAYDPEPNRIRTRWFGYGPQDDTWQRPDSLPLHKLRSFFRNRKGGIPEKVVDALPEHLRNAVRH